MTNVTIGDSFPRMDEMRIREFERQLGITLPHDYRNFLVAHNGGRPDPSGFSMTGDPLNPSGTIHWFFGIHNGQNYNLSQKYSVYQGRIPSNFLPIAGDPGGNLLCLSISGEDVGNVYFWDHEDEASEGELPDYTNVYFIADSFTDLMNGLQ
jgi:cell wall assembly regulator SMI1